jgi:hypothetical protein
MHHGKCIICSYAQASCAHLHVHHTLCTATWALTCAPLHCCTDNIRNVVSKTHQLNSMWASIFWHCCTNRSFQVILIAIRKQLCATTPHDLAITILYCFYGQLTLDFWWWNPLSIIIPLLLFKNGFRNLRKQILANICLLVFPFFIEISFGNHLCQLGFFPPNLKALLACDQINWLS